MAMAANCHVRALPAAKCHNEGRDKTAANVAQRRKEDQDNGPAPVP